MDFGGFEIGGVAMIVLVVGIVEAAKRFGVEGRWSEALALALGFGFVGLSAAIGEGLVAEPLLPWIRICVLGLGGSLAATGIYDLLKKMTTK